MKNLTIKQKLVLSIFLMAIPIIVLSISTIGILKYIQSERNKLESFADETRQIQLNFKIQVQEWKNLLLRGSDKEQFIKYKDQFFLQSDRIQKILKKLELNFIDMPYINSMIANIKKDHLYMEGKYKDALNEYSTENIHSIFLVDKKVKGIDRKLNEDFDQLVVNINTIIEDKNNQVLQFAYITIGVSVLVSFIMIALITGLLLTIIQSIKKINQKMDDLNNGTGDLSVKIQIDSKDEIRVLANSFNLFIGQLKAIFENIVIASNQLTDSSNNLSNSSSSLSENTNIQLNFISKIYNTIQNSNQKIDDNASVTFKLINKIDSIINTLKTLFEIIEISNSRIGKTQQLSQEVYNYSKMTENAMKEMSSTISNIHDSSNQMTKILKIINEISFKINLLSLNAAIEAARAGEYGNGFTIVSEEISKLADETTRSIKQIDTLIQSNITESKIGLNKLDMVASVVYKITSGINKTSENVNDFKVHTNHLFQLSTELNSDVDNLQAYSIKIQKICEEQKSIYNSLKEPMTAIQKISEKNSAASQELSSFSEEMAAMAEELNQNLLMLQSN